MLSRNPRELEIRSSGSWVALTIGANAFASLWQVQSWVPNLMHTPKYPTRTVNEAFVTRLENVELSIGEIGEFLDCWYESAVRYMLGMPERLEEHPASGRVKKQVAMASTIMTL